MLRGDTNHTNTYCYIKKREVSPSVEVLLRPLRKPSKRRPSRTNTIKSTVTKISTSTESIYKGREKGKGSKDLNPNKNLKNLAKTNFTVKIHFRAFEVNKTGKLKGKTEI